MVFELNKVKCLISHLPNFSDSKALYDKGYTSFLQVLDAERELYYSEFEKSLALQNQLTSSVRLYKALGGGWYDNQMRSKRAEREVFSAFLISES